MQLKQKTTLSGALATAACVLLGSPASAAATDNSWTVDTALLSYSEKDRVSATEGTVRGQKQFSGDRTLNLNLVFDALTGASPNGAAPSDQVQTFTRPSGQGEYQVAPGEIPLDDTFHDTRVQIGANWDAPINRLTRYNIGTNLSKEYDYQSIGINGGISQDFNKKNTMLSLGVAAAFDQLSPEGGIPVEWAEMVSAGKTPKRSGSSETKQVYDLMLGLTQVINESTLMQFNVNLSHSSGYLNDPFKIVSLIDENGRPVEYLYEARPDSRQKVALYWNARHHLFWGDTISLAYRYMTDDWGINSNTVDLHYRWNINPHLYAEPHIRYYQQSEADFYRHSIAVSETRAEYISADYRLAKFRAYTLGTKVGYRLNDSSEINLRVEAYQQRGEQHPANAVGVQKDYEMFPSLDAMIIQIGYRLSF